MWKKARETRNIGGLLVTTEKEFEDMGMVRVLYGEEE